jgi:hypothetical protein
VIVSSWLEIAPTDLAERLEERLRRTLPAYGTAAGAYLLRRVETPRVALGVLSRWAKTARFPADLWNRERDAVRHDVVFSPGPEAFSGAKVLRRWHGWTTATNAEAYQRLLLEEIFPGIATRAMSGYRGIELLRREARPLTEFVTLMWFDSMAEAARFSHDPADPERAVVPPAARTLLQRFDERSTHYQVLASV